MREKDKETRKAKNNIALTDAQVAEMDNFNDERLSDREVMAKDIFVLTCLCGQRISDVFRLILNFNEYEKETINGLVFYRQIAKKTATECIIPISERAMEIINK